MKHNRLWFKNRIGKMVFCDDHEHGVKCKGIYIGNYNHSVVIRSLLKSQNERGIIFKD